MAEKSSQKSNYYRVILLIAVLIMCIIRFAHVYPDSLQYINYAEYFAGLGELEVHPPFLYRPLLPLIAALFCCNYEVIISMINVLALCVMTDMVFNICNTLTVDKRMAFAGTLLTVISYPLIFFGPVPLTDAMAMLCFVAIIACSECNYGDNTAAFLVFIGMFFKEIVLLLGLFYVVRNGVRTVWILIPAAVGQLCLRYLLGSVNTLTFTLNILMRPIEVIGMFIVTFSIPVLLFIYYRKSISKRTKDIFIAGLVATLPLVFLGLFFAYFDGRFIWPLLIVMGVCISMLWDKDVRK